MIIWIVYGIGVICSYMLNRFTSRRRNKHYDWEDVVFNFLMSSGSWLSFLTVFVYYIPYFLELLDIDRKPLNGCRHGQKYRKTTFQKCIEQVIRF